MRIVGAVLIPLLMVLPAAAQTDNAVSPLAAKAAAQTGKFRNPATKAAALRAKTLRARGDARRTQTAAQPSDAAPSAANDSTMRLAAAAARKRAPTPPGPPRDTSLAASDRIAIQFDLAWTGDYNGLINGEASDRPPPPSRRSSAPASSMRPAYSTRRSARCWRLGESEAGAGRRTMVDETPSPASAPSPTKHVQQEQGQDRHRSSAQDRSGRDLQDREPGTTLTSVYEQQRKEPRAASSRSIRAARILHPVGTEPEEFTCAPRPRGEVRGMTVL